nr:PREDICTED: leucine-rich repeat-containing protein 16C [Latimeria chalumnae]|eukprot:XP_005992841.2 PREDICTED: leucine-rich repeat-containing protein 16C [Latimeria chalumnae]
MSFDDLEQVVSHVATSLKKIFPDSSTGKLLKRTSTDLQDKIKKLTDSIDEVLTVSESPCGGFSEAYAALCDYNGFPCKEEVQWDVDNIYHSQECREFNLLDFSHLDSRDVALSVAALSFNQWFTKLHCKDFRLNVEITEQILYLISKSVHLEELVLENCGLKSDFAQRFGQALEDHPSSALHTINLANNHLEDRGIIAFSHQFRKLKDGLQHLNLSKTSISTKGLNVLCQSLVGSDVFVRSLHHLDLSGNPGILNGEDSNNLYGFLSRPNSLVYLDLSGTDCAVDALFGALFHGCCSKLAYLNVAKNVYSHKKMKDVSLAIKSFFRNSTALKHIGLSGTKLPPEALRALLQGLACNTLITEVQLDISNCELKSEGAQVIQDHIFDVSAISSLDLSDNGFDSDMVTLVLSIGRSKSIQHISLGKNFNLKSKALADVLHRIVQLIQEEECPLRSLSVTDSRLKSGTTILVNALGSNTSLTKLDISGNAMGDTGAKMLAKALQVNTKLSTVIWDRNNTTANGFLDVAHALEKNYTLKSMPIPMCDVAHAYRSNPEKTEEALHKIQSFLLRNNQRQINFPEQVFKLQQGIATDSSKEVVSKMCVEVQERLDSLSNFHGKEMKEDMLFAEEVVKDAKTSISLIPALYKLGTTPCKGSTLQHRLGFMAEELSQAVIKEIETLLQPVWEYVQICPGVIREDEIRDQLTDTIVDKMALLKNFTRSVIIEQAGVDIVNKLSDVKLLIITTLTQSIMDKIIEDLSCAQCKLMGHASKQVPDIAIIQDDNAEDENLQLESKKEVPEKLRPQTEYTAFLRRRTKHARSIRPTPAVISLSELDVEGQAGDADTVAGQDLLSVSCVPRKLRPASTGDAGVRSSLPPCTEPASTQPLMDLPTEGEKLEHYTRARPRPNRKNRQPPSKPNVQPAVSLTEDSEGIGKLDEGVEEFFSRKLIPENSDSSNKSLSPRLLESTESTPSEYKTIKRKFGDFFAFKKTKVNKSQKSEKEADGVSSPTTKNKRTLIADFIKSQGKSGDAAKAQSKPGEKVPVQCSLDKEQSKTPTAERRVKSTHSLREGKSRSLILLSGGDEEEELAINNEKKRHSQKSEMETPNTFEQKVHVMLHRIRVGKASDAKKIHGKDGELKKAGSDGAIVDAKPDPPPQSLKPRTFSVSTGIPLKSSPAEGGENRAAAEQSRQYAEERPWRALSKQLLAEHLEKSSEPRPAPRKPLITQEQALQHGETEGTAEDRISLSRSDQEPPTPSPRKVKYQGESKKNSGEQALTDLDAACDDAQPKPRPRMKNLYNRKAISVHEEQLREQGWLSEQQDDNVAVIRLQRSPVMRRKTKPEPSRDLVACGEASNLKMEETLKLEDLDRGNVVL